MIVRLFNLIYWLSVSIALATAIMSIFGSGLDFYIPIFIITAPLWFFGWALRYVVTGEKNDPLISFFLAKWMLLSVDKNRTPNIIVYAMMSSDAEGNLLAFPVGIMPRLYKDIENDVISKRSDDSMYGSLDINGDSAIAYVSGNQIDALCFLSPEIAGKHITQIFDEDILASINKDTVNFNHFPKATLKV